MKLGDLVCVYFEDELIPGYVDRIYKRTFRVRITPTKTLIFDLESLAYTGKSRSKPIIVPLNKIELYKARTHVAHALRKILKDLDKNTNIAQLQRLLLFLCNDPSQPVELRSVHRSFERYATAFCAAIQSAPKRTKSRVKATLNTIAPDDYKDSSAYIRYFKNAINAKILSGSIKDVYDLN